MRYLLHETQQRELQARQKYLFDVFRMYFLPGKPEGGFIPLKPVGMDIPDVLFITGHTKYVRDYLSRAIKSVPEKTIVITSCMGRSFKIFAKRKEIYVPNLQQPLCLLRNGLPYGFDFEISDAELYFYNATGTIMERIQSAYERL